MAVSLEDIREGVRALGLSGVVLCIHASLRSFGWVDGGATTVIEGLLAEGCTVMVPTFSSCYEILPPPEPAMRPLRNGIDYDAVEPRAGQTAPIYTPESGEIDRYLGVIPRTVLSMLGRVRGDHPLDSFTAVGPLAADLVGSQRPDDVYAPFVELTRLDGFVLQMGVGLDTMTLIHLAEERAGRTLMRRWALGRDGRPLMVPVGASCSDGFVQLEPVLGPLARAMTVGRSRWRAFPAREALEVAAGAIRVDPMVTHCGRPGCRSCHDMVRGGPILPQ